MRLIDADALMRRFMDKPPEYYHASYIVGEINTAPTIDAVPVVHGHWTNPSISASGSSSAECSVCGCVVHDSFSNVINYCPNCGAKMEADHET